MGGEQKIRFCTGADGVRLAIATVGEGPPLVRAATWLTHVEMDPRNLVSRHWVAELSRGNFYVRYDSRGCGLSDRQVERISLKAWIEDLVERAGTGKPSQHPRAHLLLHCGEIL